MSSTPLPGGPDTLRAAHTGVCPAKEGLVKEDLAGSGLDRGDGAGKSVFLPSSLTHIAHRKQTQSP